MITKWTTLHCSKVSRHVNSKSRRYSGCSGMGKVLIFLRAKFSNSMLFVYPNEKNYVIHLTPGQY